MYPEETLITASRRNALKVSFETLVSSHKISIGTKLYSRKRDVEAMVMADGHLRWAENTGSIHRMGALSQGKSAENGWDYWFYEDEAGTLISIDLIRQQYRADNKSD